MLSKILRIFLPEKSEEEGLTNRNLLNEILACFSENLNQESVGEKMLYPMRYTVLLHPQDYNSRESAFPFLVQQTINYFYKEIEKNKLTYPDFNPPSLNWSFQFSPADKFAVGDDEQQIEPTKPLVLAELLSTALSNTKTSAATTRISYKPQNSNHYEQRNINMEAIANLDVLGKGVFSVKFDKQLTGLTTPPPSQASNALAEFRFSLGNGLTKTVIMTVPDMFVSGKSDYRSDTDPSIVKIENADLPNNCVQIKYDKHQQKFYAAVFIKARVNERLLQKSDNSNMIWHPLPKEASFMLNDFYSFQFNAL